VFSDWLPILIYFVFAAAIPASMIAFSFVFASRPTSRTKQRMVPFESGVSEGAPSQQRRFTVGFYLTAMLFILFDIEIVFLYPLAVQLNALGWFGLTELLVFVAILAVAYVYIWRKGALEWH
jgi:NADH-quinone oxidoreductase subunit A